MSIESMIQAAFTPMTREEYIRNLEATTAETVEEFWIDIEQDLEDLTRMADMIRKIDPVMAGIADGLRDEVRILLQKTIDAVMKQREVFLADASAGVRGDS